MSGRDRLITEPYSAVRAWDYDLYTCQDTDASENEVVEFIGALVYLLKPDVMVEVGTHRGYTAEAISNAMTRNGKGHLHTFEVSEELVNEAQTRVGPNVTIYHRDANFPDAGTATSKLQVDMLFIDGHLENRWDSYWAWGPRVKKGGYILVHDSLKYHDVGEQVDLMINDLAPHPSLVQQIDFLTPRGLTLFRVPFN